MAIPTRPGSPPLAALESIRKIHPPSPVSEIIVAEGYNPSAQRNEAGKHARGEILYFFDNDSIVPPLLFSRVLGHFENTKVMVVGGPSLTPQSDSFIQKCFGFALGSVFGSYRSSYRFASLGRVRNATEIDLIGCNLAMRKSIFLDEGGLDHSLHPNEETELLDRLSLKGYTLLYDPEAYVFRSQRETFPKFISQVFSYGKGRLDQTFLRFSRIRPFYFVSLAFFLYMVFLPLLGGTPWAFLPFIAYILLALSESFRISWVNGNWRFFPVMPLVFLIMHLAHGAGLLWGLIRRPFKKKIQSSPLNIKITRYEGCDYLSST